MALRKYSTTFLKATSATDSRQTPAASASVEVYRQGAKVTAAVPVLTSATLVNVRSTGAVVVNDTLQAGTDTTKRFTVTAVTSATSLTMTANGGSTINLATDARLVVVSAPLPILYNNDSSTGTPLANPATADSQGYIEFYTPDSPFDLIVRLSGMSPEVYEDQESGAQAVISTYRDHYDVREYADVATALSEVPSNSTLFFPQDEYVPPTAAGWTISKPMTILGEGNDGLGGVTVFRPYNSGAVGGAPNSKVFTVAAGMQNVHFRNFLIYPTNVPTSDGTGDGILFECSSAINFCSVKDVQIWYMGNDGVANSGGLLNESHFDNCYFEHNRGYGLHITSGADILINNCNCTANLVGGGWMTATGLVATDWRFNGNATAAAGTAQLFLGGCHGFTLNSLDLEEFQTTTPLKGLWLENCRGGVINNCRTFNTTEVANTIAIYAGSDNRGISVLGGTAVRVHYWIQVVSAQGNRGWIVQSPGPHTVTTTCPALVSLPQQISSASASGTGGHVYFPTMTRGNDGDLLSNSFIAGISFPAVASASATITNPQLADGWVVYDGGTGKLLLRHGGAWTVVGP